MRVPIAPRGLGKRRFEHLAMRSAHENHSFGWRSGDEELLEYAERVADHVARAGKIPKESRIFEAIEAFRTSSKVTRSANRIELYRQLNAIIGLVDSALLDKLKKKGFLLRKVRVSLASLVPFAVGFLTLLLTFYLAFQSSELQKADTALKEYQRWADEQPGEKIYNAWRMFRYEAALNSTKMPLTQLDAYNRIVADAKRLINKGQAIQGILTNSASTLAVPKAWETSGPDWLNDLAKVLNQNKALCAKKDKNSAGDPNKSATPPDCEGKLVELTFPRNFNPQECSAILQESYHSKPTVDLSKDIDTQYCFLSLLNIDPNVVDYSSFVSIYPIKNKVDMLTVWLLPCLYGMLGVCVYLMRSYVLGENRPSGPNDTVLNMFTNTLRIALGGLAGIIIGWFWVPPPTTGGAVAVSISSIPFGLSFLAGFSMDAFFTQLDRLKKGLDRPDEPATQSTGN